MAAATSAVATMAMPLTRASQKRLPSSDLFLKPLPQRPPKEIATTKVILKKLHVKASLKEKVGTGLTAAGLTASMMIPEVAEAADGLTPSLNNFLLSIAAGGVVLLVILGAVIAVANFDPVKRS